MGTGVLSADERADARQVWQSQGFLLENSEQCLIEARVRWSVVEHKAPSLSDLSQLLTRFMSLRKSLNPSVSVLLIVKWKEGPVS